MTGTCCRNASAGSKGKAVIAFPSNYRPTLILILPGAIGVLTGHFEDKTIVAYCRGERGAGVYFPKFSALAKEFNGDLRRNLVQRSLYFLGSIS
jgi:hypothetical protein